MATLDDRTLIPYRIRTVQIGFQTTALVLLVLGPLLLAGNKDIPFIPFLILCSVTAAGALATLKLPWERLFASGKAMTFLYLWSIADIAVITTFIAVAGLDKTNYFFLYMFTTIFFAATYPVRTQILLFIFTAASYLAVWSALSEGEPLARALFRVAVLGIVAFMASFLSRELMQQMAAHSAARAEADKRASLIQTVAAATRDMSVLGPGAVLDAVVDATEQLGFEAAEICSLDESVGSYEVIRSRGLPSEYTAHPHDARRGVVGLVMQERQTVVIDDYSALSDAVEPLKRYGFHAVIGTAIHVHDRIAAILVAGTRAERHLAQEDIEAFELLASQASRALHVATEFEDLQRAQEELHRSRDLLEATLESTTDGIMVADAQGRMIAYNEKFVWMWRLPPEIMAAQDDDRAIAVVLQQLTDPDAFVSKVRALYLSDEESFDVLEFKDGRIFERYSKPQRLGGHDGQIVGRVWSFRDVTARRAAEQALKEQHMALARADREKRRLLTHLVRAKEEERKRVASDIHDDSVQVMTSVAIGLERLANATDDPQQRSALAKLEDLARSSVARLRTMVFHLRPPALDEEGLDSALRLYLEEFHVETDITYSFDNGLGSEPPLAHRTILYRIAQEALTNVRKHSKARHVTVGLEEADDGVCLRIEDDGVGLNLPRDGQPVLHIGLQEMRERAEILGGRLDVRSQPSGGTIVEAWIPGPHFPVRSATPQSGVV